MSYVQDIITDNEICLLKNQTSLVQCKIFIIKTVKYTVTATIFPRNFFCEFLQEQKLLQH